MSRERLTHIGHGCWVCPLLTLSNSRIGISQWKEFLFLLCGQPTSCADSGTYSSNHFPAGVAVFSWLSSQHSWHPQELPAVTFFDDGAETTVSLATN